MAGFRTDIVSLSVVWYGQTLMESRHWVAIAPDFPPTPLLRDRQLTNHRERFGLPRMKREIFPTWSTVTSFANWKMTA